MIDRQKSWPRLALLSDGADIAERQASAARGLSKCCVGYGSDAGWTALIWTIGAEKHAANYTSRHTEMFCDLRQRHGVAHRQYLSIAISIPSLHRVTPRDGKGRAAVCASSAARQVPTAGRKRTRGAAGESGANETD